MKQSGCLFGEEALALICTNDKQQAAFKLLRFKSISKQHRKEANLARRFRDEKRMFQLAGERPVRSQLDEFNLIRVRSFVCFCIVVECKRFCNASNEYI